MVQDAVSTCAHLTSNNKLLLLCHRHEVGGDGSSTAAASAPGKPQKHSPPPPGPCLPGPRPLPAALWITVHAAGVRARRPPARKLCASFMHGGQVWYG